MFRNVVVGVNDDEGGRDAIALAQMLAASGSELTLAQVYQGDARCHGMLAPTTRPGSTSASASCSRIGAGRPESRRRSAGTDRRRSDAACMSSLS